MRARRVTALGLGAILATTEAQAQAQPRGATQLYEEGVRLRRQGDAEGARRNFEQAHRLDPSPRNAGQLGLAELALERWSDAVTHLRSALDHPGDDWVTRNGAALRNSLATAEGHLPPAGSATPSERTTTPAPAPTITTAAVTVREPPREGPPARRGPSPLVWIGGGVAVLGAGAALALWASGNGLEADYDARCVDRAPEVGTDCRALQRETQATLDGRATAVNVLWGVSAAGLVTAAVGVVLSLRGGGERPRADRAPTVVIGARTAGVAVSW